MTSIRFPQANAHYGPPEGMVESQVRTVHAWHGPIEGGSLDGQRMIVTAWRPTPEELARLNDGGDVYLTFVGVLPPHVVTTSFEEARSIA